MSTLQQSELHASAEEMSALIERVKRVVCGETAKAISDKYGARMRALVLTGSISRGEPALLTGARTSTVLGDADFLAIFDEQSGLPDADEMGCLCRQAETRVSDCDVECKIGVSAVYPKFLRSLKANIFSYELLTYGNVIWGDSAVLSLIPPMSASDICLEDACWTLCNRMIELLEVSYSKSSANGQIPLEVQYRIVKLWLDMATSFLVFAGSYAPTYKEREQKLRTFAATNSSQWPFSLVEFSSIITRATEWRFSGVSLGGYFSDWQVWRDTVNYARILWRWELCKLTGLTPDASDRQLWQAWLHSRSAWQNARGWLHVLRKRGWQSVSQWPHWLKLACSGSPRYWVYGIGSELFFQLPTALLEAKDRVQTGLPDLAKCLPEANHVRKSIDWGNLAADIAWNYNEFLVSTRS